MSLVQRYGGQGGGTFQAMDNPNGNGGTENWNYEWYKSRSHS